jgi:uncharacterized LabA/DUF88 family protein
MAFVIHRRWNSKMHRVVVLVDVGFVSESFKKRSVNANFNAESVYNFANAFVDEEREELMRIFFYHGEPLAKTVELPVSGDELDYSSTRIYETNMRFINELALKDNVAIRRGKTVFRGWILKKHIIRQLSDNTLNRALTDNDFFPNIQQKGVDIKIGLDVAWISEHNDISKVILITSDSDFVPAMKFARREGVQIVTGHCAEYTPRYESSFREHTDTIRKVTRVNNSSNEWTLVQANT